MIDTRIRAHVARAVFAGRAFYTLSEIYGVCNKPEATEVHEERVLQRLSVYPFASRSSPEPESVQVPSRPCQPPDAAVLNVPASWRWITQRRWRRYL